MGEKLLIGVDIGTQGVKAAVFDLRGRGIHEAHRASDLRRPCPGAVEEDPELQVRSACEVIAECAAAVAAGTGGSGISAVAIDGQMAGVIGVGEDGRNVTPYDSWLDTRCAPYIEVMNREAGAAVTRRTGGPPSFNHGPKILWWKHERPEVFKRIRAFVPPGAYAAMRLCGLDGSRAFIDGSYLHFSGFADNRAGLWDGDLCRRFGIEAAVLPRIVRSHDVVGELSPAMAGRCNLPSGVPVVAGCGDTAASFLSCGATRPGICVDVSGTASVFAGTETDFRVDEEAMVLSCGRSAAPGLWHPYAYINGGGLNLEWFRTEISAGFRPPDFPPVPLDRLNEMAAQIEPRDDDPLFIPHLGGRVSPSRPDLRGAWVGLTWSHGLAHLYRGVLEGVALEYGLYLRRLEKLYGAGRISEVRVTGGGEKNALWNRIKADVLGVPMVQIRGGGGAPLGAALLAGYGVGLLRDLDAEARQWIETGTVTEPDAGRASACLRRLARYEELLGCLERLSGKGWEQG